jgi:MFS family permease
MNGASANIAIFPWFRLFQNLVFWQAVWFLYFQSELSAAEAILLYAVYDIATTVLEAPSGYLSDRLSRRLTLLIAATASVAACVLLGVGGSFAVFAGAQVLLGVSAAFTSGTDSALLYESLVASGRADEVERQEVRAWRFAFAGLAISAVIGGAMALASPQAPFWASALAAAGMLLIALRFTEPVRAVSTGAAAGLATLKAAFLSPILGWLFVLTTLMYVFSHVPFVFGQPVILSALETAGLASEAPVISGAVTSIMMLVSLGVSVFAPRLRASLGLPGILLVAFGIQIALCGIIALSEHMLVIALLFLRMVPDSLSRPFVLARIQPLLSDESRATYLSIRSFAARLIFSGTLFLASFTASAEGKMAFAEIRTVLMAYTLAGVVCLIGLALAARWIAVEPEEG